MPRPCLGRVGAGRRSQLVARRIGLGETTVLVRYLNRQAPVRLAFVPSRPNFTWPETPATNYVDEHIFAKLSLSSRSELAVWITRQELELASKALSS